MVERDSYLFSGKRLYPESPHHFEQLTSLHTNKVRKKVVCFLFIGESDFELWQTNRNNNNSWFSLETASERLLSRVYRDTNKPLQHFVEYTVLDLLYIYRSMFGLAKFSISLHRCGSECCATRKKLHLKFNKTAKTGLFRTKWNKTWRIFRKNKWPKPNTIAKLTNISK